MAWAGVSWQIFNCDFMRSPTYSLPVSCLDAFIERLRQSRVSIRISFTARPGEFKCHLRRSLATVEARGYRLGDDLRFDLSGVRLFPTIHDSILACGGSKCDFDTFLAGWETIAAKDTK